MAKVMVVEQQDVEMEKEGGAGEAWGLVIEGRETEARKGERVAMAREEMERETMVMD